MRDWPWRHRQLIHGGPLGRGMVGGLSADWAHSDDRSDGVRGDRIHVWGPLLCSVGRFYFVCGGGLGLSHNQTHVKVEGVSAEHDNKPISSYNVRGTKYTHTTSQGHTHTSWIWAMFSCLIDVAEDGWGGRVGSLLVCYWLFEPLSVNISGLWWAEFGPVLSLQAVGGCIKHSLHTAGKEEDIKNTTGSRRRSQIQARRRWMSTDVGGVLFLGVGLMDETVRGFLAHVPFVFVSRQENSNWTWKDGNDLKGLDSLGHPHIFKSRVLLWLMWKEFRKPWK